MPAYFIKNLTVLSGIGSKLIKPEENSQFSAGARIWTEYLEALKR